MAEAARGGNTVDVARTAAVGAVDERRRVSPRMTPRRFPPPWTIEEHNNACFIVKDATGKALAYFSFEEEPGRRSAAELLAKDEARRMAANFGKLPSWCTERTTSRIRQSRLKRAAGRGAYVCDAHALVRHWNALHSSAPRST